MRLGMFEAAFGRAGSARSRTGDASLQNLDLRYVSQAPIIKRQLLHGCGERDGIV
ncbi:hypothetical protein D9M69_685680 [compost metagenome]